MKSLGGINQLRNQRGTAMIETLPILVIFIVLFGYSLGLFGVVHTAILNSIGSRTYAIETLMNRSDVTLFRDRLATGSFTHYARKGTRFHLIDSEAVLSSRNADAPQYATARRIAIGLEANRGPASTGSTADHNINIYNIIGRNGKGGVEASPAWVMVGYGMCIDARCGD